MLKKVFIQLTYMFMSHLGMSVIGGQVRQGPVEISSAAEEGHNLRQVAPTSSFVKVGLFGVKHEIAL